MCERDRFHQTLRNRRNRDRRASARVRCPRSAGLHLAPGLFHAARRGGRVTAPAYTRSQATHEEIVLGEVWTMDEEGATFLSAVKGSVGVVITRADCETIELIRWPK